MKNASCSPGPAFAIETVKGRSCLRLRWNSSSNSFPQIEVPPCTRKRRIFHTSHQHCMQNKNWMRNKSTYHPRDRISKAKIEVGAHRSVPEWITHLNHETLDHTVDDRVIVIVVLRVSAEVLHLVRGRMFSVLGPRISRAVGETRQSFVTRKKQ
jgi:hypothetical protein